MPESESDLGNDVLLVAGLAFCVMGFFQGYWYWCFIGVLFFLSGCGALKQEEEGTNDRT